ncbi:hypothetical protein BAnh1_10770 [Bartonella australis AUST/NH1]|uniref:Uncharacterized protein n=1 Tax=Bartonella australis (strain Aust/NH1) TaxID=1094489 RepID=M1P520_BARAA|nr:hypothetical protein BAnh1_10770 [Bartonella australis AUST/NH1]
MHPFISILLLISCTDDFGSCYSDNTMVEVYSTAQACEKAMIPSVKKFAYSGQQIFAQCTNIRANLNQQKVTLVWSITSQGDLFLKEKI